jgi:predicted nucleic acid-binding protein
VHDLLAVLQRFCTVHPLTEETHLLAVRISERLGVHIYDACILAAAKLAGCDTLWTEDMQAGQVVEGVTIRNPFAG